jgi:hypothetical protein
MKTAFQIILVKIIAAFGLHLSEPGVFCKGFFFDFNNSDELCMN